METRALTQSYLRIPFKRSFQQEVTTKTTFAGADSLGYEGVHNQINESHPERDHMLTRLSHFFNDLSTENWDEYGAYPIESKSYDNAVLIVNNTPEEVLKLWNVFPSPNGTISFEFKAREIAAMSVGNSNFSFIARRKRDNKALKGKLDFDYRAAVEVLREMSKHLGYL